mmetsp:Transcript_77539/g.251020  ORF Transcript_77539/g.251020 Transcript_77539/m.251020 type:complete len:134 (-) Transcript_77539:253-654(-)
MSTGPLGKKFLAQTWRGTGGANAGAGRRASCTIAPLSLAAIPPLPLALLMPVLMPPGLQGRTVEPEWSEAASSVAAIGDGTAAAGKSPDRHTFVGKDAAADVADKRTEQPDGSDIFGDAKADGDGVSAGRQPA